MKKIFTFYLLIILICTKAITQQYNFASDLQFPFAELYLYHKQKAPLLRPLHFSKTDTFNNSNYTRGLHLLDKNIDSASLNLEYLPFFLFRLSSEKNYTTLFSYSELRLLVSYKRFTIYSDLKFGYTHTSLLKSFRLDTIWLYPELGLLNKSSEYKYKLFNIPSLRLRYDIISEISVETGFATHFFGSGYRSLLLSDYQYSYPYIKIDCQLSKFNFVQLYGWQKDATLPIARNWSEANYKFTAMHFATIQVFKNVWFSLFEAAVCPLYDTTMRRKFIEFNYLLPVVMYRPIDFSLGSNDNILLGSNINTKVKNSIIYFQFLLDEFYLNEFRNDLLHVFFPSRYPIYGAWVNKYAWQLGWKQYFMFDTLIYITYQQEINVIRPYTYSHRDVQQNYSHLGSPLAHPFGANLVEFISIFQFFKDRLFTRLSMHYLLTGIDSISSHFGRNIHLPTFDSFIPGVNIIPVQYYGNTIGQGIKYRKFMISSKIRYIVSLQRNVQLGVDFYFGRKLKGERESLFFNGQIGCFIGFERINFY